MMVSAVMSLPEDFAVLFVDDDSPDGTSSLILGNQQRYPDRVHLLHRPEKKGLALAYFDGFDWAMQRGFQYVYEMDCDFSHDPQELIPISLLLTSHQADMVIGSRYIDGVRVSNWSIFRTYLSRSASLYVRLMTGLPITDPTAGYMGYRASVIQAILRNRSKIKINGYGFQVALKYLAWKKGFRFLEHPITFSERRLGMSKMTLKIIIESILEIPKLPFIKWL
jgi:dolichol-phosphate mannosyltransferase